MKLTVVVMPRKGLLDPQGAAVGHALHSLGMDAARGVRVGKVVEIELAGEDTPELRARIDGLCRDLLSNPVIEDYRYELTRD